MKNDLILNGFTSQCVTQYMSLETQKAPSVILKGASGMGKSEVALQIVRHLLAYEGNLEVHPDFIHVKPENGTISKALADTILEKTVMRAVVADRKVVFVEDAECMNDSAANSILKVLEDEHEQVVFVFSVSGELLYTIQSRCMVIEFHPLMKKQVQEYVASMDKDFEETAWMLCGGRMGVYSRFSTNKKYLERMSRFLTSFQKGSCRDLLESTGAMKEKDSSYFYDAFSNEELEGWFQGIFYVVSEAVLDVKHPLLSKYRVSDLNILVETLVEKRALLYKKGLFTRNEFFDLLHTIIKLRKEAAA